MKKLFVILLTLCLTIPTFASEIDLTALSDEELLSLQQNVETEIANRELKEWLGSVVPMGTYVVGTDIKAGRFVFVGRNPDHNSMALLHKNAEDVSKSKKLKSILLDFGEQYTANLEDGNVLMVEREIGIMEPSEEKEFWQP